jgi:membrane protease YdiL (CAAX protease family)
MRIDQIRAVATTQALPHDERPSTVRRRRLIVCVVLIAGAALMAYSLTRPPGAASFYWLTTALAAAWTFGSVLSGPLHLGRTPGSPTARRPVLTGVATGLAAGLAFLVGGLVVRNIPVVAEHITDVLEYTQHGPLGLMVAIAMVNGVAEELFFRGALYTALGRFYPVLISTLLYAGTTLATGNPMLAFAGLILGTVCGVQRRATGGVLAPILTHVVWGLIMVLALPRVFGL